MSNLYKTKQSFCPPNPGKRSRENLRAAAKQLAAAGVENEAAESWFLMEAVCGISRSFYLLHEQEAMDPMQEQVYFALTRQCCGRMPLQYLTGEQEFMGLPFCVNEHVLIPRQDTEVLVEEAIRVIQKEMYRFRLYWNQYSVFLFKHTGDSSGYFRGCVEGCTEERKRESGAGGICTQ